MGYMDKRIVFSEYSIKCIESANINGYNLEELNCLSLKLMGIEDMDMRVLIVGYIDSLINDYGDRPSLVISDSYHADDHSHNESVNGTNVCCICVTNEVNTCISPCGHAAYCSQCSQQCVKHSDRCPICREKIGKIITVYKAGFNRLEIYIIISPYIKSIILHGSLRIFCCLFASFHCVFLFLIYKQIKGGHKAFFLFFTALCFPFFLH